MPAKKSFSQKAAEAFFGGGASSSDSESEKETIPRPPPASQKLKAKAKVDKTKVKIEPGTEVAKRSKRETSAFRTKRASVLPDAVAKHFCFLAGVKRASVKSILPIVQEMIDEATSQKAYLGLNNMLYHNRKTLTSKDLDGRRSLIGV